MPVAMLQCPQAGLLRFSIGLGQVHSQSERGNTNSIVETQGGAEGQLGHIKLRAAVCIESVVYCMLGPCNYEKNWSGVATPSRVMWCWHPVIGDAAIYVGARCHGGVVPQRKIFWQNKILRGFVPRDAAECIRGMLAEKGRAHIDDGGNTLSYGGREVW